MNTASMSDPNFSSQWTAVVIFEVVFAMSVLGVILIFNAVMLILRWALFHEYELFRETIVRRFQIQDKAATMCGEEINLRSTIPEEVFELKGNSALVDAMNQFFDERNDADPEILEKAMNCWKERQALENRVFAEK